MGRQLNDVRPLLGLGFLMVFVMPSVVLAGLDAPIHHYLVVIGCNLFGVGMFASACWVVHATTTKRWRVVSYALAGAFQVSCVAWLASLV